MKRQEYMNVGSLPEPKYWFPFTENNSDIMGNFPSWSYSTGVTYSDNGAYFNGSAYMNNTSAIIPNSNLQTFSLQMMIPTIYTYGIYTMFNIDAGDSNTGIGGLIAPDWGFDLVDNPIYNGSSNTDLSLSSVPWVANTWYTLVWRQDFSTKIELFINGTLRASTSTVIPSSVNYSRIYIGTHPTNPNRKYKGYIKNVRMWNTFLTDEQIATL